MCLCVISSLSLSFIFLSLSCSLSSLSLSLSLSEEHSALSSHAAMRSRPELRGAPPTSSTANHTDHLKNLVSSKFECTKKHYYIIHTQLPSTCMTITLSKVEFKLLAQKFTSACTICQIRKIFGVLLLLLLLLELLLLLILLLLLTVSVHVHCS